MSAEPPSPPCRVLVVDDDPTTRPAFKRFLALEGVEAECCADIATALALAGEGRFDGFVLDILLWGAPRGHALIAQLRADPRTADAPIMAVTGGTGDLLEEALRLGADAAVYKGEFKNEGIPLLKRLCEEARMTARGSTRVLIVEDDPSVSELMARLLAADEGTAFRTRVCASAARAEHQLKVWTPDLVLLDLGLPGKDGLTFLPELRARRSAGDLGIIVVSATLGNGLAPVCLDLGADDCIHKPFSSDEFLARVRAVLRRTRALPHRAAKPLSAGPLRLDVERKALLLGEQAGPALTRSELGLLRLLFEHHPGVVTWAEAERVVRGVDSALQGEANTALRSLVAAIRAKHPPEIAACLQTHRGLGLALDVSSLKA